MNSTEVQAKPLFSWKALGWALLYFWFFSTLLQAIIYISGYSGTNGIRDSLLFSSLWLIPIFLFPKRIKIIAAVIGVVPGLCYRYFNSKQELFDSAVSQYVLDYCAPIVQALKRYRGDIDGLLDCVADLFLDRDGKEKYHEFFHQADNKTFHSLLFLSNCDYLFPYVKSFFDSLNENGTAAVADTASFSKFVLYGLFPILNDDELSPERKTELARGYITGLLKL